MRSFEIEPLEKPLSTKKKLTFVVTGSGLYEANRMEEKREPNQAPSAIWLDVLSPLD